MKSFLKTFWTFLVRSSADPKKSSLFIRGALLGVVNVYGGHFISQLEIICDFGSRCTYMDPNLLDMLRLWVNEIASGVYYALLLVATITTLYGLSRKIMRTLTGNNLALNSAE